MEETNSIKNIMRQEYIKSSQDPIYFLRKYAYIQNPTRGRILFNLYPYQEKVLKLWQANPFSIIIKSRQLGISTLASGYAFWLITFHPDKNVLCLATKQETAKNMVTKVKFMYDNLPSWLKVEKEENNRLTLRLKNGSQIKATSAASDAGRSESVSLLIVDESAFIDNMDELWTSILPTLSTGGGCIALSTPNLIGNWFHKTYTKAEANENEFLPIKLPWFVHPERDQKWRDLQDELLGDPRAAAQECDCVFNSSGDTVFYGDFIDFYEKTFIKEPSERRGVDHNLWIWESADYTRSYIVCLPPGEKVLSDKGLQNIEDVNYNDKLIDRNGDYVDVLDIKRRLYDGLLYEIQPTGTVRTTKFTDEHPILISKHISKEIWYKNKSNKYRRKQELNLSFDFVNAKDVEEGDWIKYPNIYYNKSQSDNYFLDIYKPYLSEGRIDFQNTVYDCILKEDFWWFIGMWLAEGWVNESKNGFISIQTSHNENETYIHDRIINLVENLFERKCSIIKSSGTVSIKFHNKGLGKFLIDNFDKGAKNKSIPEWVKFLPDNLKIALIHGYLEGDGCSFFDKSKNNITLNFVSISLKMLEDFQELLFSLGVCSTINNLKSQDRIEIIKNKSYKCESSYILKIGVWDTNIFLSKIDDKYKNNLKIKNINTLKHIRKLQKGCFLSEDNKWIYFRIKNIKKHPYKGVVCNFTTDNTNTFLCRNITTHNCADVARGDGKDYSTAQVIDVESNTQVAEFKGQLGTKEFGNLLVALATEYNEALLVVENASIGWAVIQQIIERNYMNLYYSPKSETKDIDLYYDKYMDKNNMTPGFTTSSRNRPMMIGKFQEYVSMKGVTIQSKRLLEEMKVFIWKNGKAEAQQGYNDDLVMAFAIAMFIRDTALMGRINGAEMTKKLLDNMHVNRTKFNNFSQENDNPYNMETPYGTENFSWVL